MLSHDQFSSFLTEHLGAEALEEHHEGDFDTVPPHVFRVVSNEDYQQSMRRGYMKSDERNNWLAQQARGDMPHQTKELPTEGTVAGRWAEPGYLPENAPGRIVKFMTAAHPDWEVHPDVPEGDYIRTHGQIPMSSAVGVTPPITVDRGRPWKYQVHEED